MTVRERRLRVGGIRVAVALNGQLLSRYVSALIEYMSTSTIKAPSEVASIQNEIFQTFTKPNCVNAWLSVLEEYFFLVLLPTHIRFIFVCPC